MHYTVVVVVFFSLLFNLSSASLKVWEKRRIDAHPSFSFDCGRGVFELATMHKIVADYMKLKYFHINSYQGSLYSDQLNYYEVPIPHDFIPPSSVEIPKHRRNKTFIILNERYQIVDVVTELKNGHHIKCKKNDHSNPEPSLLDPPGDYGYQCGYDQFSREIIQWSLQEARSKFGKSRTYPALFNGGLYGPNPELWMYPVLRGKKSHQLQKLPESTYYIVFAITGELVDVIAELACGDYIRCSKATEVKEIDQDRSLGIGYYCGTEFFSSDQLFKTAEIAQLGRSSRTKKYPLPYNGPPFHEDLWIYPLLRNGQIRVKGSGVPKFFLVLDDNFQILVVATMTDKGLNVCDASLRGIEDEPQETDDFVCDRHQFSARQIAATVEAACRAIGARGRLYPASYVGPVFDVPGPYLTWPLYVSKMFSSKAGNFRIVMNRKCNFAGVISKLMYVDIFTKCPRKTDGSIPGDPAPIPITEKFAFKRNPKRKKPVANIQPDGMNDQSLM